jgi:hypothetical protein
LGNCLWNDVLFLSPVHPVRHLEVLEAAGHTLPPEWRRYFQIDARLLEPSTTVIYRLLTPLWPGQFDIDAGSALIGSECQPFSPEALIDFTAVPRGAREYFANVPPGAPLALFLCVTHVLYRGRIDVNVEGVQIIEV